MNKYDKLDKLSIKERQEWNERFNIEYNFVKNIGVIIMFFMINVILILTYGLTAVSNPNDAEKIAQLFMATWQILKVIWYILILFIIVDMFEMGNIVYQERKWWKEKDKKYINIYGDKD